ncbi:MAG: glycosyltransferase [Bacteroidetes bacterium]|nr:glycosyltransferase [Bacteroidota bacterium]
MKKILHISYDLRDRHNREITTAVSNLIKVGRNDFNSFIIDLVRVPFPQHEMTRIKNPDHLMINVLGFPYGLFMNWSQNRAFNFVKKADSDDLVKLNEFDMIHTHKLTFEGLVGYKLAKQLEIPLVVTLRQTDTYVFNRKPGAVEKFKPVIKSCDRFFYLIPQIIIRMKKIFGESFFDKYIGPKTVFLPNIVERKISTGKVRTDKGMFLTVFRMTKRSVKRKNIKRLLLAFKELNGKEFKLKIIGTGDYMYKVKKWVDELELKDRIIFVGKVENNMIDEHYASAEAFLLPSISESFGMVYAESLLNGTPIMYSKGYLGFDGFFDGVGAGVDPKSIESIKNGIEDLLNNGSQYRKNIESLHQSGEFKVFSKDYIRKTYIDTLEKLC